jgi:hydroxymethylpyrimidine/phosphomethylpyrimidine kinase
MASERPRIRVALSIAGSDSGGGAGIQADLKAFAACGVHGTTAITAITAQNTVGVDAVQVLAPELILAQVRAVARDLGVDAVKIGMLGDAATVEAVAAALDELRGSRTDGGPPVVLDPVMVSESGARLLAAEAREALVRELLPRVDVVTPNLPEARVLAGAVDAGAGTGAEAHALARAIHALGPRAVVVTGGHRDAATDVFLDATQLVEIPGVRHPGGTAHGSGCTHSSVLAARLALGDPPLPAARIARRRAGDAVRDGLATIGAGPGPVDVLGIARAGTPGRSATGDPATARG